MKLSCTSSMVPGKTLTEKSKRLKEWGYDGIGIFVEYEEWHGDLHDEIVSLEENTGIIPCEFCFSSPLYGHLMDDDAVVRLKAREMYKKAAEICAQIGAVTELEYELGPQDPLPLFNPYAKMSKNQEVDFLEMYEDIASVTEGSEGYVLIEPINRYEAPFLNNVDHCIEVLEKMKMKSIGLLLDVFHLSIEENNIAEKIIQAGALTKYVHLGDNNRLMPGYGHIDWKEIITSLSKVGFNGFMSLECSLSGDPEETLPKTAEFLKNVMEGVEK